MESDTPAAKLSPEDAALLAELTSNEGERSLDSAERTRAQRKSNAVFPVFLAFIAVGLVLASAWYYMSDAYAMNTSRSSYISEQKRHASLEKEYERVHEQAAQLLTNCAAAVADESLCEALDESLIDVEGKNYSAPAELDPYEAEYSTIAAAAKRLHIVNGELEESIDALTARMNPIFDSVASKTMDDYEAALERLEAAVKNARDLVAAIPQDVHDEAGNYLDSTVEDIIAIRGGAEKLAESAQKAEERLASGKESSRPEGHDLSVITMEIQNLAQQLENDIDALTDARDEWVHASELEQAKASSSASASAAAAQELQRVQASASASAAAAAQEIERLRQSQNAPTPAGGNGGSGANGS